jgi:pimeloyl-ACP methyl ester carboxylesterase
MSSVIRHLRAFMDKLGLAGATVVGQSRGAFCAARLAMEFPHLVSRLVLINSASISVRLPVEPLPGTLTHETYYERFTGDTRADAEVMSVTYGHITDEWVAARTEVARLEKTREAAATFKRLWTDIFAEFEVLKNEILKWIIAGGHTKPTLIVWGVGDPTTTARDAFELGEIMQPHVDKLRLHLINRSGHWPHREYPDEVGSEIRQFISHT